MDTAWIQVFVLTIAECVAPAGKTVCQEQELEMLFLNETDCEIALEQMVTLKSESESVIVDAERSSCAPSARQREAFASLGDINAAFQDMAGWQAPDVDDSGPDFTQASHAERLSEMKTCEESNGVAPCKIGEIVVEGAEQGAAVEVWRRDQ
jgi:hypothetical protein